MNLSLTTRRKGTEVFLADLGDGTHGLPAHEASMPTEIRAHLTERHGLDTVYLGPLAHRSDGLRVHALEARGADDARGEWYDAARLARVAFAPGQPAGLVAECLSGGAALPEVPWTEPGWLARAGAWAEAELARHGTPATAEPEQLIVSPWACTLRIPAGDTHAFLKAAPHPFPYEPDLTALLRDRFPEHTVPLIARHPDEHWMLSLDIGEARVVEEDLTEEHLPIYRRALGSYARMQHRLAGETDALLALGVPDRRPATLPDLYDEILDDTYWLAGDLEGGIGEADQRRLRAYAPEFRATCEELAAAALPDTLLNVDWWHGNLSFRDQGDVMFDWAESVVGNPCTRSPPSTGSPRSARCRSSSGTPSPAPTWKPGRNGPRPRSSCACANWPGPARSCAGCRPGASAYGCTPTPTATRATGSASPRISAACFRW